MVPKPKIDDCINEFIKDSERDTQTIKGRRKVWFIIYFIFIYELLHYYLNWFFKNKTSITWNWNNFRNLILHLYYYNGQPYCHFLNIQKRSWMFLTIEKIPNHYECSWTYKNIHKYSNQFKNVNEYDYFMYCLK